MIAYQKMSKCKFFLRNEAVLMGLSRGSTTSGHSASAWDSDPSFQGIFFHYKKSDVELAELRKTMIPLLCQEDTSF